MTKSELKQLIKETIDDVKLEAIQNEMNDPYQGIKHSPDVTKLTPKLQSKVEGVANTMQNLHSSLKKEIEAIYGQKFQNIKVYIKVDSVGNPEIQIYGHNKDPKIRFGGNLTIGYPKRK
jgi:hypothetical protein